MSSDQPEVSVIIPHYSELGLLDSCLDLLSRQTYPKDRVEIIIADNNSPEGRAAIEAVIGDRGRFVSVSQRGAGSARNGGVAAASGEILAFTDADCVPEPDWIAEGVKALRGTDMVGGRMIVRVENSDRMTACEGFETVFAFNNERYVKEKGFSVTANLFCRKALFETVGGFLSAGMAEDVEWCNRATKAGFKLTYAPLSIVGHPARRTWPALLKKWRRANQDNFGFFCQIRKRSRFLWVARNCALPFSAVVHSPRVLRDRRLKSFPLRLAVLATLYRLRFWRLYDSVGLALKKTGYTPV